MKERGRTLVWHTARGLYLPSGLTGLFDELFLVPIKLDIGNSALWSSRSIALYVFKKPLEDSTLSGPESDQTFPGSIFSCSEVGE